MAIQSVEGAGEVDGKCIGEEPSEAWGAVWADREVSGSACVVQGAAVELNDREGSSWSLSSAHVAVSL